MEYLLKSTPFLLLTGDAVPVEPAAVMEVVTHHVLAKQKKDDYQDNYKQELSKPKRGVALVLRGRPLRISCHLSYLSADEPW
jgi:hypothetical protein